VRKALGGGSGTKQGKLFELERRKRSERSEWGRCFERSISIGFAKNSKDNLKNTLQRRFFKKVKRGRTWKRGLRRIRENHKGYWKSPKRTDNQKVRIQGAKSCRFPWKAQIPETEAAGLEPWCPPGPLGETNSKREWGFDKNYRQP